MPVRRVARTLLLLVLVWTGLLAPAAASDNDLTVSQYIADLDRIDLLIRESASKPPDAESIAALLQTVPSSWRVKSAQQPFEISADWLRQDLWEYRDKHSSGVIDRISSRLHTLRTEAVASEKAPPDSDQLHARLAGILATPEFGGVEGPSWFDRFKARLWEILFRLMSRLFTSSTIANVSNILLYGIIALAVLVAAYFMYRAIRPDAGVESLVRDPLVISAKEWTVWMREARAAANAGNWRDAIHLGYWCGISFLEAQGLWAPDRARTPREYLRLLSSSSQHRATLIDLTGSFELVWYGSQDADADAFSKTLGQLERLGCR